MGWTYTIDELAASVGAAAPGVNATFSSVSTDTRTLQPGDVFFALSGENFDGNHYAAQAIEKGAAAVVTAQSVDGPCLVVDDPLAALQAFAAHHRAQFDIPLIAITGSVGKTTSKDLIAGVLGTRYRVIKTEGNFNNEIGCPLSLLQMDDETDMAIIEMGATRLGNIAELCGIARPTESAITRIVPAHLEGFGTIENVERTKGEIAECLPEEGTFYVNTDDPACLRAAERFDGRNVRYGSTGEVTLRSCGFNAAGEMVVDIDPVGELSLPLASRDLATNVLLAVAIGLQHGVTEFEPGLRGAAISAGRLRVLEWNGITIIDDTYNANPASTEAALRALMDRPGTGARLAALGDMLELGPESALLHRAVGEQAAKMGVNRLFTYGGHGNDTIQGAHAAGLAEAEAFDDHAALAESIRQVARHGDVLLVKGSRGMRMETVIEALRAAEAEHTD